MEISVYAVYPDTCGRSYPYIFVYADVTVSENYRRLSFLCNAHALLTNPLRCPDTNRIRVDGRIRFVYATCGRRYFCIRIKKKLRIQKSPDTCGRGLIRVDMSHNLWKDKEFPSDLHWENETQAKPVYSLELFQFN